MMNSSKYKLTIPALKLSGLRYPVIMALGVTLLLLSACTTVPEQLKGDYSAITPESDRESHLQSRVRWGGVILEPRPEEDHTCFEVLSKRLQSSMRPSRSDQSQGRFV